MNKIVFKNLDIEHICKLNLRNSYISVHPHKKDGASHAHIVLKTPKVSQKFIINLLTQKESWIRKQLYKTEQNPQKYINLEDEVLLFGEIYSIDIDEAQMLRDMLQRIKVDTKANVLKCYDEFYKHQAIIHLTPRLEYYSSLMGLEYKEIKFRKMRSRWGSCSSSRVITLNTELIKVKRELSDYVLVHELAHLVHMNHSKAFHDLVENHLFDSKSFRKELKKVHILHS